MDINYISYIRELLYYIIYYFVRLELAYYQTRMHIGMKNSINILWNVMKYGMLEISALKL